MIKKIFHNKIVANAGWLISGKIIQMIISLFVGILSTRYLGPSNYGILTYATAYTTFFTSFCTLGINSVIVKEFIDNKNDEGKIIGTSLGLRAISSIFSAISIIGISFILDKDEPVTILVVALCSLGLVFHIFETFNYWFQYRLESKKTAIASLIGYTLTAIYKLYLLITNKSVVYFALATSVDYICIAIVLFIFYKTSGGDKFSFSWEYGKKLLRKSCHFILPGIMVAIYSQTDKIMLKHMISETETGYYSTAISLCNMWTFILSAIIDSLSPTIMQSHNIDKLKYEKQNRILYCIIFYISFFVSIIFSLFGKQIIYILYGEEFILAANPLRIITWYTAFSYLGVARNTWIVCENKQKYLVYIYLCAAASNVILNIIFIPQFGAVGAAIASLIAQIITVVVIPFFIKDLRRNSQLMIEAIIFKGLK